MMAYGFLFCLVVLTKWSLLVWNESRIKFHYEAAGNAGSATGSYSNQTGSGEEVKKGN